ncbi:restriction endonuclease subunit S [Microcystis aeruginosa]|uniref:restriction endonuclease subunit S n=1 Tax=Microcystis aeruginosa TaxID=1126 RepID=UPI00192D93A8|nr:restriction endonuclease subunit S [Microcystis aeruginosa]WNF16998.1 restriction endonuclease subunit S [Microcystis aeruginosa NRERC-214]
MEWGEFNIIDIFDVKNTRNILSRDIIENSGETPYLCASGENNAVSSYISFDEKYLEKGNCIFIGGKTFVVSYQEKDFYSNDSHNLVLYLKNDKKRNKACQLFLVACINRSLGHKYFWGDSISNKKIQKDKVSLPIRNSKIDFEFMESFIAELEAERIADLEAERIADLEAYLLATGLKDYTLTDEEKQVLDDFENEQFEEFNIVDLFEVKNSGSILSRDIIENSGKTPYLCASSENNAVSSYISYDDKYLDKGNCVFIGGKTFVVTYQEKDFYSNDSHNLVLYLKNEEKRTKLNQLYLATCINISLGYKYSWGDSISNRKIQKDKVSLPIQNNQINYAIMETFISAIQKLVIKEVVLYADRKIAAIKTVVNK